MTVTGRKGGVLRAPVSSSGCSHSASLGLRSATRRPSHPVWHQQCDLSRRVVEFGGLAAVGKRTRALSLLRRGRPLLVLRATATMVPARQNLTRSVVVSIGASGLGRTGTQRRHCATHPNSPARAVHPRGRAPPVGHRCDPRTISVPTRCGPVASRCPGGCDGGVPWPDGSTGCAEL